MADGAGVASPGVRLEDLDYDLRPERIAQLPIEPRDAARLLVDRGSAPPEHRRVADLPDLLRPGDLVVVNDTRVLPARLRLRRATGGTTEVLLLEPVDDAPGGRRWEALARPARKLRAGEHLSTATGEVVVAVVGRAPAGDTFHIDLLGDENPARLVERIGEMPLPPYITTTLDRPDRSNTIYATRPGSAAAPTAGLHLTPAVLDRLAARGIDVARVELVVGLDTFQPVSEPDPLRHRMHSERYRVPASTWDACRGAPRVVAIGTTTVRARESVAASSRLEGRTELFLHAGVPLQVVDVLMTNFHLPRTTLLMMVDAFVGPRWRALYATALTEGYRFLSFGDAMLLDRHAT
ncbi:tRNA preQ1(34) S-adenosylmethionine ribosyltransferase-isomerase QueA [soil metagenome]